MSKETIAELELRLTEASAPPVDPVERIDALNALSWQLRNKEAPRANGLSREARELSREHGYPLGQARATRTLCMTLNGADGLKDVIGLAFEAKELFDEAGDGPGRAASRDFLSSILEYVGDLVGGMAYALDALTIAREIEDPVREAYALSSVGGILAASGEPEEALERMREALRLFEDAGELDGVGGICSRLSKFLAEIGRLEEALTYANRCRVAGEATHNVFLQFSALRVMAEVEIARGNTEEAERIYREALGGLRDAAHRNLHGVDAQVALARLLIERGAFDAAEVELKDALARVDDEVSLVPQVAACEVYAKLCESQGRWPETVEHLRAAQAARQGIAQQEARNKMAQVEARSAMEAAKKDAEIHKLRFVELHAMQAKLVEAEKMALLGKLAAGTSHELHTPLGVLRSNAALAVSATSRLTTTLDADGETGARAAKLAAVLDSCAASNREALERIAAIAHSLERFTQLDQAERGAVHVAEGLSSALALLAPTVPPDIVLERAFEDVPAIEGWPRELNHAFMTVLQNAVEAIDGAGVVTTQISASDEHVIVSIMDSGRGMTQEQVASLFDVAWARDGARVKMRLGLSAAYATVQKHGGAIDVTSEVGEGTTVSFRFPISGR